MRTMDESVEHPIPEPDPSLPPADSIPVARPVVAAPGEPAGDPIRDDDMLLPTSSAGRALVDALVILAIFLLLQVVGAGLVMVVFGTGLEGLGEEGTPAREAFIRKTTLPSVAISAVGLIAAVAIILRWRRQSARSLGLGRHSLGLNALIGVGAAIIVPVIALIVTAILQVFFPQLIGQMQENADRIMKLFPNIGPLGFALFSMVIGFYEEVVFRGFLMTRLRRATGSWTAGVLISTVVFVVLHAGAQVPAALIAITILSLVFSVITIWRKSLVPVIVAHTLFDLVQFLYLYYWMGDAWV